MANKHAKAKNPRIRAVISLVAIVVVVAVCAYLGLFGFGKGTMINYLKPWGDAISLGLDLRGGVYTVYQAEDNGDPDFDTKMESTVSILTSRLTRQGFTEATVTRQGSDRIRVEIPNVSDPNQILTIIGTPAQLYFVDEDGNNLMEGSMVKNAQAAQDQDGKPCIAFELTDEGAKIFAEATASGQDHFHHAGRRDHFPRDGQYRDCGRQGRNHRQLHRGRGEEPGDADPFRRTAAEPDAARSERHLRDAGR